MSKKDIDLTRKYNVGDTVIYKRKYRNFLGSVDEKFIHSVIDEEFKKKKPNITKVLAPYLVKGKPTLSYEGIARIIEVETYSKTTTYTLNVKNNSGENIIVINPNILKVLSIDYETYEIIRKLSKNISFNKFIKTLGLHDQ
jgi:hypothetical protein